MKLLFLDAKNDDVDQILRVDGILTEDLMPGQRKASLEVEDEKAHA